MYLNIIWLHIIYIINIFYSFESNKERRSTETFTYFLNCIKSIHHANIKLLNYLQQFLFKIS